MKQIPLPSGGFTTVDDSDFILVRRFVWYIGRDGYIVGRVENPNGTWQRVRLHRYLLGVTNRSIMVDHIDHDIRNNQKSNLRLCSQRQNSLNRVKHRTHRGNQCSSKYKGVIVKGNRILMKVSNKTISGFTTEIDAAMAYDSLAVKYYGKFACTNKSLRLLP